VILIVILWIVIGGLIVGALGRLAIPGPNPMSLGQTILVGIGGSVLGGIVGQVIFGRGGSLLLAVLFAALIVWLLQRRSRSA
jgi:uncharacterized membrane protein YeaQ/YmgE (transglycosylase-associated protein family)